MTAAAFPRASVGAVVTIGVALLVVTAVVALCVGLIHVPPGEVASALAQRFGGSTGDASLNATLVTEVRLPRIVSAICVGGALGVAGCLLQALLRNPLASPTVIGTAQAAAFGKVLGVALGFTTVGALTSSFAAACTAMVLVLALSRTRAGLPTVSVVLTGFSLSLLFGALTALTVFLHRDEDQLARMALLLAGGLWQVTWSPLGLIGPTIGVALVLAMFPSRELDLLALGESDAQRLGVDTARFGVVILILACMLTALAVCLAGIVAFVGLVVPHAARRLVGSLHRTLLPASALLGATFVVVIDTLCRTLAPPNELPLAVLSSLVGVPCFLMIVRALRARSSEA